MPKIKELAKYIPAAEIFALFHEEQDTVILESSLKNNLGQYTIIGRNPYLRLEKREQFTVNGLPAEGEFAQYLSDYLKINKAENPTELPLVSGAIGYFAYDYQKNRRLKIPEAVFVFYDQFIIEDHTKNKVYLIANGKLKNSDTAISELEEKILAADFAQPLDESAFELAIQPNFQKEEYKQAIDKMINYIVAGDIYIANMTQRLDIKSNRKPYAAYSRLRQSNPAAFSAYLNYGGFQVVCASPERFLRVKNNIVVTRPIKGTRKRGASPEEDMRLKKELADSAKDKSELLMIVDLERNDLNRVCQPGSVVVEELFAVETYATLHHLIANVKGELRAGLTVVDVIGAAFPGGSITGAPKIRAMEIIEELEHGDRGLYTGTIGYISLNGDCDFNIVIRTAVYQDGVYSLGVGGGITFESDLEFEYEETLLKAKAILEALA